METSCLIVVSVCLCVALMSFLNLLLRKKKLAVLPPGPSTVPIIGNYLWLRKPFYHLKPILRNLHAKYGPIVTVPIGFRPNIFINNHTIAHQALIQNGAIFADRPPASAPHRLHTSNQHTVNSAAYGSLWRLLRRNLTSEILHPSRVKSYALARKWVLDTLTRKLSAQVAADSGEPVPMLDHFRYSMFSLLVFMCFGKKLDDEIIKEIEATQKALLLQCGRFSILAFMPWLGKVVFRKWWKELFDLHRSRESVIIPLIRARQQGKKVKQDDEFVVSYVDTLLELRLPDEGLRKLTDQETIVLCSGFLTAGTHTTTTALEWIMARIGKSQDIQAKLYREIVRLVGQGGGGGEDIIKEEDLQKMPYLKAVVLEGLRRHPPIHFGLPHAVTQDFSLNGFVIPKTATVHFITAEMALDPQVWKNPMKFRPERFLSNEAGKKNSI